MANRKLYKLELNNDCIIVFRTKNNLGRQGVFFKNGFYRREYNSKPLPKYIVDECFNILNANDFELKRGYTISGKACNIN